jgi:hypothetical protein
MANTFITPQWVANDVALEWQNSITLVGNFDRQWDESWRNKPGGAQIGYTVQARLPQRFVVSEGDALVQQAILNQTVPITLNHPFQVGMGWSSGDATVVVEEVNERYTKPAGTSLASKCDATAGADVYKSVYFSIGTPGVAITSNETYTDGVAKLLNAGVPKDYVGVIDPRSQSKLLNANFALFNPTGKISSYFNKGQFAGSALGVEEWYVDSNLPAHTTGTFTASTPVVSGASQTGSSLAISGMGTYTLNAGDVFTIAGVNMVNPQSYVDSGDLQQFVMAATVAGSSTATLTISPSIITSGQLQTVTASPANGAAITFLGSTGTVNATLAATVSKQALIFNPAAFAWVMADLIDNLPGAETATARSKKAKLTMRIATQYNIQTNQLPTRIDCLVGAAPVEPYFALRAWS